MRSLPQDTLTGLVYPSVIGCGFCSQRIHLQTSTEDCFRVIWSTCSLRGITESYLSLQKLHAEGGRVVQNPTSLTQGGRSSAVLFQFQRIIKTLKLNFWNLIPAFILRLLYPTFLNPLQVSPDSIPSVKHSQIIPPEEKPSKQINKKTKPSNYKNPNTTLPQTLLHRIYSKTDVKITVRSIKNISFQNMKEKWVTILFQEEKN